MDPKTGEILAMANVPGFNPNTFFRYSPTAWRNKVVTDCFDPGSTFKPFLAAGALEEDAVKENDTFYCEDGAYRVGNKTIRDVKNIRNFHFRRFSNIQAISVLSRWRRY
jgi:peptidoglycan synthetase FtsI (EC 2.4.1.129)